MLLENKRNTFIPNSFQFNNPLKSNGTPMTRERTEDPINILHAIGKINNENNKISHNTSKSKDSLILSTSRPNTGIMKSFVNQTINSPLNIQDSSKLPTSSK